MEEDIPRLARAEKKDENSDFSQRHICSSLLVITVMCLTGFNATVTGILSHSWRTKFDVTYFQLTRVWMLDGMGIMFASVTCSLLLCIQNFLGFGVGTLLMASFPCAINFRCFQLSALAGGFGKGLIFVYGTNILSLWPKSSSLVLIQLSFISYALGGLLACQSSEYYEFIIISWKNNLTSIEIKNNTLWATQRVTEITSIVKEDGFELSLFQVIFVLLCCCLSLFALIWSLLQCCEKFSKKQKVLETLGTYEDFEGKLKLHESVDLTDNCESTQNWFANNKILDVTLLMFLATHFFFSFGIESILTKFLGVFEQRKSHGEKMLPLNDFSIYPFFCGLTAVGRFLCITFSKSYSSTAIVAICLATNVVTTTIISAYYDKSENLVLFCISVFSAFLSPLLPAGLSWANSHLCYGPRSLGLAFLCSGLGCASFCWFAGLIMDKLNEMYLMFFITGVCCLCCITYTPLLVKVKNVVNGVLPTVTYV